MVGTTTLKCPNFEKSYLKNFFHELQKNNQKPIAEKIITFQMDKKSITKREEAQYQGQYFQVDLYTGPES